MRWSVPTTRTSFYTSQNWNTLHDVAMFRRKHCLGISIHKYAIDVSLPQHSNRLVETPVPIRIPIPKETIQKSSFSLLGYQFFLENMASYRKTLSTFVRRQKLRGACCASSLTMDACSFFYIKPCGISLRLAKKMMHQKDFQKQAFSQYLGTAYALNIWQYKSLSGRHGFIVLAARKQVLHQMREFFADCGLHLQYLTAKNLDFLPFLKEQPLPAGLLCLDDAACFTYLTAPEVACVSLGHKLAEEGIFLHADNSSQHTLDYCEKAIKVLSLSPIITKLKKAYVTYPKPLHNPSGKAAILKILKNFFPSIQWECLHETNMEMGAKKYKRKIYPSRASCLSMHSAYPSIVEQLCGKAIPFPQLIHNIRTNPWHWVSVTCFLGILYALASLLFIYAKHMEQTTHHTFKELHAAQTRHTLLTNQLEKLNHISRYWKSIAQDIDNVKKKTGEKYHLLDWLAKHTPPLVFFQSVKRNGKNFTLQGTSHNHKSLMELYQTLNDSGMIENLNMEKTQSKEHKESLDIQFILHGDTILSSSQINIEYLIEEPIMREICANIFTRRKVILYLVAGTLPASILFLVWASQLAHGFATSFIHANDIRHLQHSITRKEEKIVQLTKSIDTKKNASLRNIETWNHIQYFPKIYRKVTTLAQQHQLSLINFKPTTPPNTKDETPYFSVLQASTSLEGDFFDYLAFRQDLHRNLANTQLGMENIHKKNLTVQIDLLVHFYKFED